MIKNTKRKTAIVLNRVEKKEWREPQITELKVKETKGGDNQAQIELEFWFISLHS